MDDIVRQALRKWPSVPHTYGWLALDARGDWYLRDDQAQSEGPFPAVKGSRIEHEKLREFIGRNYLADERGCWYFQNGPQRVFVELETTPWIWRLDRPTKAGAAPGVNSHTGCPAGAASAWQDEQGWLYLTTDLGFGLVHTLDIETAADAIEAGSWLPAPVRSADLPARFGYCRKPASPAAV